MRTLVYYETNEDTVSLQTYSQQFGRSNRFYLTRKEIENSFLQCVIARDLASFAELRTLRNYGGRDVLQIDFTWISSVNARGEGKSRLERIRIPYALVQPIGIKGKTLSIEPTMPRIKFYSQENLKAAVENPYIRHKLSQCIRNSFQWPDKTEVEIYDDFAPYSFHFETVYEGGYRGIHGGLIYHKNEDGTGSYSIHT